MSKKEEIIFRRATRKDLQRIVEMLVDDKLGATRENPSASKKLNSSYVEAYSQIEKDPNQYLMLAVMDNNIVGTCHLTLIPSLTYQGALRLQIEAVRVDSDSRGQKIGSSIINEAIDYARANGAKIIQLTTNKQRPEARQFYEIMGFEASHEGMKMHLE